MSIFKKEMSAREKFINGAKNVASTAGAIGLATLYVAGAAMVEAAEINAEYQAKHNSNDHYNSNYSGSSYRSVANSTKDITLNFMKDFMKSFGSLETHVERNMRGSYMHKASYNGPVYKSYYTSAEFRVACSAYDWKLFVGTANGVVMMVLTNRYDGIIDVASCYSNNLYGKFRAESAANYRVNDIHTAVLKALQ